MWDYWLDEQHGGCDSGCASPLHRVYAAHMDLSSPRGQLTGLDRTLVSLFELRVSLDIVLEETTNLTLSTSDEDHHLIKSGFQYMALDFHKFNELHGSLVVHLDERERLSISHLSPILEEVHKLTSGMQDLRHDVVHPGSGLFGVLDELDANGVPLKSAPENSFLVCAHLINTFIDGLMHAMPGQFCAALSKIPSDMPIRLYDHSRISDKMDAYIAQNPANCVDYGQLKNGSLYIASELVRVRWALHDALGRHKLQNDVLSGDNQHSPLWNRLERHKILNCVKQMVIELCVLFVLHDKMRSASPAPPADDAIIGDLLAHRDDIGRLRDLAVLQNGDADGEPFSAVLDETLGYDQLILLVSAASEWARINVNHYRERCAESAQIPDLPAPVRRLDFLAAERDAALYRVRAHNALERLKIPAMVS